MIELPKEWNEVLSSQVSQPYFRDLQKFVDQQRSQFDIFPPAENVYEALKLTAPKNVRVVILGQDPYHGEGQAHGLSFSVLPGVKPPPSLRNIFKELNADLGCEVPGNGSLEAWAKQGVLLLNTVLTVRANEANSHRKQGWEKFTDEVIRIVSQLPQNIAFVLWGKPAQQKKKLIDTDRHFIIESAHPSPLSASRGFLGSKPFSKVNAFLKSEGLPEIDWQSS